MIFEVSLENWKLMRLGNISQIFVHEKMGEMGMLFEIYCPMTNGHVLFTKYQSESAEDSIDFVERYLNTPNVVKVLNIRKDTEVRIE